MPTFTADVDEIRKRARQKIEEGAVTDADKGDVKKTIDLLNDALATEIVCVLRYMPHCFMATGVHAMSVRDEFKEHADAEREHADRIADRVQQLGGKPDFNPKSLLELSASRYVEGNDLAEMIKEDLVAGDRGVQPHDSLLWQQRPNKQNHDRRYSLRMRNT
jgi:bacterioferritin